MKIINRTKWLLLLILFGANNLLAQIQVAEYFFDTDPGVGNGISLTVFTVQSGVEYDSTDVSGNITVPLTMKPGKHILYTRMGKVVNGALKWSQTESRNFYVSPTTGHDISAIEYFYDNDLSVGSGSNVVFTPLGNEAEFNGQISTTGLSHGTHTLQVRSRNAEGLWSQYEGRKINVVQNNQAITHLEYFFDNDPGCNQGTLLSMFGNQDSSEFSSTISTTGLSYGNHRLNFRCKTQNGIWSQYETKKIKVLPNGNAIAGAEYFYDTDPGPGNGIPLVTSQLGLESEYTGTISTTNLGPGRHKLFVRAKDVFGKWSQYEMRKCAIDNSPISGEYFFDTDTGVGNGFQFTLNSIASNTTEYNGNFMAPYSLFQGSHRMYMRTLSAQGHWSNYDSIPIYINCSNPVLGGVQQVYGMGPCGDEGVTLSVVNSNLNQGLDWHWYEGTCGASPVGVGSSIFVAPNDTNTYYVRGEGSCTNVFACTPVAVNYNAASHITLKMFIEGYYISNGEMREVLLNQGQASCDNITDSVDIELYNPLNLSLVTSLKAMLHTDGSVRCNFYPLQGSYFVAVKHRNALETWSSQPIELNNEMSNYDFTVSAGNAYANNQKMIAPNVWGFYSGDIFSDRSIDAIDYVIFDPDLIVGASGYYSSDLNGDGLVDAFDYLILDPNILYGVTGFYP